VAEARAEPAESVAELRSEAMELVAEASSEEMLDWTDARTLLAEELSNC
jgi:hypothetical protein